MNLIIAALTFGLAAGLNPGPLGIFVIHQTISKGNRHGFFASLIPFITDVPIVILISLLSLNLGELKWFTSTISIIGSIYLLFLAYKIFHSTPNILSSNENSAIGTTTSWLNGVKLNALNPAPYIFWGSVGNAYIIESTATEAIIFVFCLLLTLCVTKFIVALLVKSLGKRFNHNAYALLLKCLSLSLVFFSVKLFISGIDNIFT